MSITFELTEDDNLLLSVTIVGQQQRKRKIA